MPKKEKEATGVDVRELIAIHMVTDGEDQKGWVHTHGLHGLDLPELEMRGVPLFLMADVGQLLNHVAQYMYNGKNGLNEAKPIKLGEVMATGPLCRFKFVKLDPIPGDEAHFEHERWALSDEPMRSICAAPGCTEDHAH